MSDHHHTPIFSLKGISFGYGQCERMRPVLHDVDFSLHPGQRIGLYGPNGSGKTTLFRCITGLARPQSGQVLFHGAPLNDEKDFHELRCKVGFVLQHAEDQLFFPTVLEDVAFGPLNLGLDRDAARDVALETLCLLGLEGFEHRLTHKLSGGEKKLVCLAAVLSMRPEALLLDEPAAGLDQAAEERLIAILQTLPAARLVISHDRDFLRNTVSQALTIANGRLEMISF